MIEGNSETFKDVIPRLRFSKIEFGSAANDVATEFDEALDQLEEAHHLRPTANDRQHDDAETRLERGVFVEVVENDLGHLAALQLDDDSHPFAVRLISKV